MAKIVTLISLVLVIIGGLNWGILGITNINIVARLLVDSTLIQIVYVLVGIAALYLIVVFKKMSDCCN